MNLQDSDRGLANQNWGACGDADDSTGCGNSSKQASRSWWQIPSQQQLQNQPGMNCCQTHFLEGVQLSLLLSSPSMQTVQHLPLWHSFHCRHCCSGASNPVHTAHNQRPCTLSPPNSWLILQLHPCTLKRKMVTGMKTSVIECSWPIGKLYHVRGETSWV